MKNRQGPLPKRLTRKRTAAGKGYFAKISSSDESDSEINSSNRVATFDSNEPAHIFSQSIPIFDSTPKTQGEVEKLKQQVINLDQSVNTVK